MKSLICLFLFLVTPHLLFAQRTITVLGEGSASAPPEFINLNLSVNSQDKSAQGLFSKQDAEVDRLMRALTATGIASTDIDKKPHQLNPDFEYGAAGTRLIGYRITTPIDVKLTDLKSLPRILDIASSSGASMINVGGYGIRSHDALKTAATKSALQEAKEHATELAKQIGAQLGDVQSIEEREEVQLGGERERMVRPDPLTQKVELKVVYGVK